MTNKNRRDEHESLKSLRKHARSIYGLDVDEYQAGRPDYPKVIYETLNSRCTLIPNAKVLEIGPGTGQVTRHLLENNAHVTVVEPDQGMARYLRSALAEVAVIPGTFEEAGLNDHSFDLCVSATAFHSVDQSVGIPKIARLLRPGGWVALWWTIFDDPGFADPFRDALGAAAQRAAIPGGQRNVEFQMDQRGRTSDLATLGGFENMTSELFHWSVDLATFRFPRTVRLVDGGTLVVPSRIETGFWTSSRISLTRSSMALPVVVL